MSDPEDHAAELLGDLDPADLSAIPKPLPPGVVDGGGGGYTPPPPPPLD